MTVYVDELRVYPNRHGQWCHMMTDGNLEELHDMARAVDLHGEWFQGRQSGHPHYDLVASKRERAVALGAVEVTSAEMVNRCSATLKRIRAGNQTTPNAGGRRGRGG